MSFLQLYYSVIIEQYNAFNSLKALIYRSLSCYMIGCLIGKNGNF